MIQSSQVYAYTEYKENEQKIEKDYNEILEKNLHLSPRHQIKVGVLINDVKCNEGFELILRHSNGLPVCVKSSSIDELINRGWALDRQETVKILEIESGAKEKIIHAREEILNEKQENNTNENHK